MNDYDGVTHDYTKKSGVVHTEILLPDHVPKEYANRSILWNAVERVENNRKSQLAREIEFALPKELTLEQNTILAREYVQRTFVTKGMIADFCIHDSGTGNPHVHVMLTMRPIEENGSWGAKSKKEYILDKKDERIRLPSGEYKSRKISTVDWNNQDKAEEWREEWATIANKYLSKHGIDKTLSHKSYARQGNGKIPTIHLGVAASQMEQKGITTDRGNINREVANMNKELRQARARIKKLKVWLYSQPITTSAPSTIDTMKAIADNKNLDTRWQRIRNLKTSAKVLLFLTENGIDDLSQLVEKVIQMYQEFSETSGKIKDKERRLNTLSTHLAQWEIHKQYKAMYKKYKSVDPKKRDAFYNKHSETILLYEDSKNYFDKLMNGRADLPIKAWQDEQQKLLAERFTLCDKFYRLKDDIKTIETLQRNAEKLIAEEAPQAERKPVKLSIS